MHPDAPSISGHRHRLGALSRISLPAAPRAGTRASPLLLFFGDPGASLAATRARRDEGILPAYDHRSWFFWARRTPTATAPRRRGPARPKLKEVRPRQVLEPVPRFSASVRDCVTGTRLPAFFSSAPCATPPGRPTPGPPYGTTAAPTSALFRDLRAEFSDDAKKFPPGSSSTARNTSQGPAEISAQHRRGRPRRLGTANFFHDGRQSPLRRRSSRLRSHPDGLLDSAAPRHNDSIWRSAARVINSSNGATMAEPRITTAAASIPSSFWVHHANIGSHVGEWAAKRRQELGSRAVTRMVRRDALVFGRFLRRQRAQAQPPRCHCLACASDADYRNQVDVRSLRPRRHHLSAPYQPMPLHQVAAIRRAWRAAMVMGSPATRRARAGSGRARIARRQSTPMIETVRHFTCRRQESAQHAV